MDLFAGAGGASIGLARAGFDVLAVERDPDAVATHNLHSPCVMADVGDVSAWWDGRRPFLMQSGFPCQPFSSAGKRMGAEDDRNGWPATLAAIDATDPVWFIGENVRGLTFHSRKPGACGDAVKCPGCYLQVIESQLRERFAYVDVRVLNASDYGVPQHRRRVFIVAGPSRFRWPAPTHGDPSEDFGMFPREPWVTMGEALGIRSPVVAAGVTGAGVPRDPSLPSLPSPTVGTKGTAYEVAMYRGRGGTLKREARSIDEPSVTISGAAGGSTRPFIEARIVGGGTNPRGKGEGHTRSLVDLTDRPSTTIAAQVGGGAGNAGPFVVAPTITTADGQGVGSKASRDTLERAIGKRRLTVEECATLQGFPAGMAFTGTKTSQYRQVGNAVPPVLIERLARAVLES